MVIERQLLLGLLKNDKDFLGALNVLPRNLRLMYVHSYQSYIWNKAISERLKQFGNEKAVIGDIVLMNKVALDTETESGAAPNVKILTETDVNQYTINDIVLPLPAPDAIYPTHSIGFQFYADLMAKDGLQIDNLKSKWKEYSIQAVYRKVIAKPVDMEYSIINYNDFKVQLLNSDLDTLENNPLPQHIPDGKMKALCLKFTLSQSTYATMLIRELFKQSTAPTFQKSLNEIPASN